MIFKNLLLISFAVVTLRCTANSALAQPYDDAPGTLRVMSWNVEWMFDYYQGDNRSKLAKEQSAPSKEYWNAKLSGVASAIAAARPEIVALQEIEGGQTLGDIAQKLRSDHNMTYRYAFIQGTDTFTEQDVGFLVAQGGGLTSYHRYEQSKKMFDSRKFYNVSKHLVAEFQWGNVDSPLTIMTVHLRSTADAEDKRTQQAKLARHWLNSAIKAGEDVIILGDFNSEHPAGTMAGDIAEIAGETDQPKMVDLLTQLDDPTTSTHLVLDKQFDRIMVSESMMQDGVGQDWVFEKVEVLDRLVVKGNRDGQEHWDGRLTMSPDELDLSDHFPVMATFRLK